jgi:ADP-ribose pyrophosphatase
MTKNEHKKITFTHNDYEVTDREILYEGFTRLVRYHFKTRLFDGGWSKPFTREVMERRPAAGILPYDPFTDEVILIEQFRPGSLAHPGSPWMMEIVAGIIEMGESPDAVVIREAVEEAGCKIEALYPVYEYFVTPSCSNEYIHIYCGKADATLVGGVYGLPEESENIRAYAIPAETAFEKVRMGEIKTAPAIIALQWLQLNRHLLKALWLDQLETK